MHLVFSPPFLRVPHSPLSPPSTEFIPSEAEGLKTSERKEVVLDTNRKPRLSTYEAPSQLSGKAGGLLSPG